MSIGRPYVLIADGDPNTRLVAARVLRGREHETVATADVDAAVRLYESERPDAVILDVAPPGFHGLAALEQFRRVDRHIPVIVVSEEGSPSTVVQAMRLGATDFVRKPLLAESLSGPLTHAIRQRQLSIELEALRNQVSDDAWTRLVTNAHGPMAPVSRQIDQAATSDASVLIRGEVGTGKELVARVLHARSSRSARPFVKVNCGSLPSDLLESELFGCERGAYATAMQQRPGKLEFANQGTMFLDEVGDLSGPAQDKLLQLLHDGRFSRVGGRVSVWVDARVVAATNRPIEEAVSSGLFRPDLFARLDSVSICLPPLRERRDDIPAFTDYFLKKYSVHYNTAPPRLSRDTAELLSRYHWPGNLRELENMVRRMVLLGSDATVRRELQRAIASHGSRQAPAAATAVVEPVERPAAVMEAVREEPRDVAASDEVPDSSPRGTLSLKDIARTAARAAERVAIARMLQRTRWNRKEAAEFLGISYKALLYKIKENGLDKSPA